LLRDALCGDPFADVLVHVQLLRIAVQTHLKCILGNADAQLVADSLDLLSVLGGWHRLDALFPVLFRVEFDDLPHLRFRAHFDDLCRLRFLGLAVAQRRDFAFVFLFLFAALSMCCFLAALMSSCKSEAMAVASNDSRSVASHLAR